MEWKVILPLVLGLLSTGGLIGYWIKSKIDSRQSAREWKRNYYLEDLKKQRELLLEFLGSPRSTLTTLHGVGDTWDEKWRRDKSSTINEWVERYRPHFPEPIQRALTGLANTAGSMVLEESQKLVRQGESFQAAHNKIEIIRSYVDEIGNELRGK